MAPKQAPTRRLFAVLFISLFVNAIMMFLLFGNDTPVSLRPDHLARNRFLRSPEDSETATSNNGHNRVLGEKGTAVKKIMTTMERFHAHIKIARASSLSLSRYPSVLSPLISQKEEQQEQQQDGTSSGREGEVNDDDDEAADDDGDDGETADDDDDDDESDVSHEEEEKEEVAKESILEGNGSQKWRGKTQNEKGNDKDESNYHFRKGEDAQAAKSTRSVFEDREQTQKKDHGKCEEITVALPSHLFELQLVPVLLEATQSALGVASGLSITALVTLVRDGNPRDLVGTTDDAKFKTVVSSCRAVLYRGRGSCMIRIPSLVGEDQEKVEKRWLGRYRIVVQSDIDSTEHTSRRRDDSRSFLPPYISRSLVAFAVHAPICRHVSRPLKVRKRHILQLPSPSPRDATASETKTPRGHFGDEEKKVRFVSGGTMRGRVVWGPSEIIVLESSLKLQELSGDEENSTRTRLTILEGSSVFLAPGVVLEVGHGAVLQTFGEKFRPVVFSAMPARDAIHRSFTTKQATRSGEDSRYLRQLRYEIISPESAWGEVSVLGGGRAVLLHTILTGGGGGGGGSGDRSNAAQIGRWGHSNSRPVLRAMGTVRARTMARLPTTTHNSSGNGGSRTSLFAPTLPTKMGAALTMLGGGVVDCPGKAIASSDAIVTLQGVLVSRVDTGGEHRRSAVHMRHCHTVEIPTSGPPHCGQVGGGLIGLTGESDPCSTYREDASDRGGGGGGDPEVVLSYHDPRAEDDNDGLYLKGVWSWESERRRGKVERHYRGSIVEDCTFANGGDDAIDVKSAVVSLRRLVIDGWLHEGIAASAPESPPAPEELIGGGGEQVESPSQSSWTWSGSKYAAAPFSTVRVTDSLVRRCGQGVEAGYGAPQVRVERVLVEACVAAAFRYGDGYDWKYRGHLSISHCATTPMEPLFLGSSSRGGMEVTGGRAVRNFVWTKKPTRKAGSDRQPRGGAGGLSSSLSTSLDQYRDAMLEAGGYYGDDVFLAASALDRLRRNHTAGVGAAQGSGRLYEGAVRVVCSDMVGLSTAEIGTEGSGADEAENAGRCDDAVFGRSERGVLAKELAAHLSNLLVGAMPVKHSVSNTKTIAGEGPLLSSMEPAFVREDCPIGSDFSAAMASMSAKWQTQWSGTGFMKDTFPLNSSLSSRGASMSTTALVYCRVKPRFLDRFERQYSFLFGTAPNQAGRDDHLEVVANPRGYYPNWHEVEYGDRKLVPLGALTAELFRPSLELLAASLRHPGIAQIKHMCGTTALLTKNHRGDDKSLESLESVTAEYSRTAKNRDERKKGGDQSGDQDAYAFVFAQELAPGVPINRRVAPLPIKAALLGAVTEQPSSPSLWFREQVARIAVAGKSAFDSIDLAIELADAVRAMHESPVGSVVHGDLKWSNIITPVATDGLIGTSLQRRWGKFHGGDDLAPMLKLIDFDNAVLFSGGLQDVMPASPIAFCCDMGRGHNHLAPECQRCSQISPAMDVYVVGQRLLNFFDNQRINVFKQLGCVTSIYDTRSNEHNRNSTNAALLGGGSSKSDRDGGIPCDVHSNDELPLTSILRNGPYIEATWPGMVPAMASALSIDPHLRPTMAALTVELLAVRSRASTVTVLSGCRAKAWGMTTGAVPFLADPITAVTSTTKSQKAVVSPADVSAALMRSSAAVAAYAYAAANMELLPTKESASQSDSYALDAAAAAVAALFPDYECSSSIPSASSSSSSSSSSSMPLLRRMLDVGPSPCFTASLSSASSSPTNWQLQFDASMSTDKAAKRSPSHSPLKGPMDTGSAASRALAYWRRVLLPSNASPWDLGRTYMVVPNTVQLYSHSYLSHREERLHGCGLRFLLHHSSASTTTATKGEGPQVHKETAQLSPWLSSSSSSSSGNEGLGGRSLRSWRVMAKAVHSANGHFDDESLFREIKASALDAVLGTRLVPPCIGARLLLGGQGKDGLELATEAVARHPSSKSLRDSKRISCLSPQTFVKKQTGDSKESHKLEHQASPFNKTQAKDAVLVDASLCLYLDVVDDASSAAITSASHAAAIHAAEFESSHGGQSREKNDRSDNSFTVIELESSSSPPLPNSYPRKKKLAVPAAIDAAVAWSGSSSANSAKPSRKITAATSTPTFFRHQNELWDSSSSSDRNLSSSSSRLLFHPSHRNVVEYVIFSVLANCAKSAHNHFQLVAPLSPPTPQTASGTRKDKGEQRRRDESKSSWTTSHLPSLVMIDNDRCFTEYRAVFNAAESSLHQTDTSRRYFPPGMTPRHVDEGGPPEEHLERFVRWRRLLWNTCEWIDGGLWVDEGKMKESKFSTKSTRAFVGIGGVRDLVEKLRWHARPENPSLSAAVREAIAEDTLHDRLQRTDTEAFGELDARAAELIQRVDECDKMRSLRTFHNLGLSKKPRSTKTKHWIKLSVGPPTAQLISTNSRIVNRLCSSSEPGGVVHCRASDSRDL